MLIKTHNGQAALEAALLADLQFQNELERIEKAFASISEKLTELINQQN